MGLRAPFCTPAPRPAAGRGCLWGFVFGVYLRDRRVEGMIDTIRLSTTASPTDEQLRWCWLKRENTPAGKLPMDEYYYNVRDCPLRATYRRESRQGTDQLLLEMSLPKVCFGNNWQMIANLPAAVAEADKLLETLHEVLPPLPSIGGMSLSRLDVCYNYSVHELLPFYVQALSKLDYPHRTTVRFNAQTVEFRAKATKSKFYDKHAESRGEAPCGLLRHEITFHRAREIKKALGFDRPVTLHDLNLDLLKYLLDRDLERLGIREKPFATFNGAVGKLLNQFGPNRGGYRYTILSLYQQLEREQICSQLYLQRNTLNRLLAEIRKTGLSLALSESQEPLPPLEVLL